MKSRQERTVTSDISANFSRSECACKCGCGAVYVHPDLPLLMEIVRELNGDKPITPNSVYRCKHHNAKVGGTVNSYHTKGMAADMPVDNPEEVYNRLSTIFPDQYGFILYKSFVHIDCRTKPFRQDRG